MKRKQIHFLTNTALFALFLIGSFTASKTVFAFGQMTEPIVVEKAVRGQVVEELLILFNSNPKDETFLLIPEGDIAEWTIFYATPEKAEPIESIVVPASDKINAYAVIKLPGDIPNGTYTGDIAILYQPEGVQTPETGVTLGQKVIREVNITVTDEEIIDLTASVTPQEYTIKAGTPLQINAHYTNNGNIIVIPQLQIKIANEAGATVYNAILPYPENEEPLKPRSTKKITYIWPTAGQEPGKYRAQADILLNGKNIFQENFTFHVDNGIGEVQGATDVVSGSNTTTVVFAAIIFVLIAIIVIMAGKKKKTRASEEKRHHTKEEKERKE